MRLWMRLLSPAFVERNDRLERIVAYVSKASASE